MGTFHGALHAQTWKLAESGRDRDQSLQPPMPWTTPDRGHRRTAPPDQSVEPPHQSRQDHHPMEVHPKNKRVVRFITHSRGHCTRLLQKSRLRWTIVGNALVASDGIFHDIHSMQGRIQGTLFLRCSTMWFRGRLTLSLVYLGCGEPGFVCAEPAETGHLTPYLVVHRAKARSNLSPGSEL